MRTCGAANDENGRFCSSCGGEGIVYALMHSPFLVVMMEKKEVDGDASRRFVTSSARVSSLLTSRTAYLPTYRAVDSPQKP